MYDPSGLYIDPILTDFSVGLPEEQNFAGLQLMPETPVRTKSGNYRVFDRSHWLIFDDLREPGTVANEISGAKWSQDTFATREHSLQAPVMDEERQQLLSLGGLADPVFGGAIQIDPEQDATSAVVNAIMRRHEKKVADLIRNTANYPVANTVTLAGAQQWDDYTNGASSTSNPVADIMTALRTVYLATGQTRWPNVIAMPVLGMSFIENHPRIVDRFKTFSLLVQDAFQQLTGFAGKIIPLGSVYNAGNNLDSTVAMTSFWGKDVWVGIVDETPGQRTMTFGKTFAQLYPNGVTRPTERWREEPRKSDLVRSSFSYDQKIVSSSVGYLIKNAFSTTAF